MTLSEMADHVCGKVNQTEDEDLAACKTYLRRRHELIWNQDLYKDSLAEYRLTLSPTGYTFDAAWMPTKGVLLLPPILERVIAVRTAARKLNVQRPEFYYRVDYDAFSKTGTPVEYLSLPRCVWETNAAYRYFLRRGDAADVAAVVKADVLDSDGVGLSRVSAILASEVNDLAAGSTERVDALVKNTSTGAVYLHVSSGTVTFRNDDVIAVRIATSSDGITYSTGQTTQPGQTVTVAPPKAFYRVTTDDPIFPLFSAQAPYSQAFSGLMVWNGAALSFGSSDGRDAVTLAAADTTAKLRCRVRLVEIPTVSETIRVLGKRSAPALTDNNDQPAIAGCENCLMAFAQADMLQRERQYGKAKLVRDEEAIPLLEQLRALEVVQQAHNVHIVPEHGYGDDSDFGYQGFTF